MNDVRELKEEALLLGMENAKLRELCERSVIELYANGNVTDAATENLFDDMRELGIEVNNQHNIGVAIDGLLPCPFCGGKAERAWQPSIFATKSNFFSLVVCTECRAATGPFENDAAAAKAWNRRVR